MAVTVKGTSTALATGTTKFKTSTAVHLCGHTSATTVTVRNEDDDADEEPPHPEAKTAWGGAWGALNQRPSPWRCARRVSP